MSIPVHYEEGDKVRLLAQPTGLIKIENTLGTVVQPEGSDPNTVLVEFDGDRWIVNKEDIEKVTESYLMRSVSKLLSEQEELPEVEKKEPFEDEIAAMFKAKRVRINKDLSELGNEWLNARDKLAKLGVPTSFVSEMTTHLIKLRNIVEATEDSAEINKAKTNFIELFELHADISNTKPVRQWVELQVDRVKAIFG